MPNRFIRESCRSSRNLDRLTDFEERLFWRMLTTADDYGRFMADPELVRAACFPYRTLSLEKVREALCGLESHSLITLYTVDDRQYGEFVTFKKHQGSPRSKSRYPEKQILIDSNELDGSLHANADNCHQLKAVLADSALPPNTNTKTNLNSSEGEGDCKSVDEGAIRFEEFWQAYPARNGKKLERAATEALFFKLSPVDQALAVTAARNYADGLKQQGISPKDPKRWLRDGQGHEPWRDWTTPAVGDSGGLSLVQTCQERVRRGLQLKPCGQGVVGYIGKRPVCQVHKEEHDARRTHASASVGSPDGAGGTRSPVVGAAV